MQTPDHEARTGGNPSEEKSPPKKPVTHRGPSIIVACIVVAIAALSIWYLVRPEPLLCRVRSTRPGWTLRRASMAASRKFPWYADRMSPPVRCSCRSTTRKRWRSSQQAQAAKVVAEAQLANINAGTRPEVIAARKAAYERAQAAATLAQQTYDRTQRVARQRLRLARAVRSGDRLAARSQKATEQANSPTSRRSMVTRVKSGRSR